MDTNETHGACERAGVPRIHIHGLRHTFGSQMAMAGADPFAIMKAMGHTDIKTTMIYVSPGKNHIREQVDKLNGIYVPQAPDRIPHASETGPRFSGLRLV